MITYPLGIPTAYEYLYIARDLGKGYFTNFKETG